MIRLRPTATFKVLPLFLLGSLASTPVYANTHHQEHGHTKRADAHAPIGISGDHLHGKNGWMFSYRYMRMDMDGNRKGTTDLSPEQIVTTETNRFFGVPGQPPTLRVVPLSMTTDMHMFGLMYAPDDRITLMAMIPYLEKSMQHITYAGGAGTTPLGNFTSRTSGLGDLKLSALMGLTTNPANRWHAMLGISLPSGSNTKTGAILTPTGGRPIVRLPYPMQLGSGTFDLQAGLTWQGKTHHYSWGAQYHGTFRTGSDEGYRLGNEHKLSIWGAKLWSPGISSSLRLAYREQSNMNGQDPNIVLPVQTADPARQGKQRLELGLGLNLLGTQGVLKNHRFSVEWTIPLSQDLDGPQLKADSALTFGYRLIW